MNLSSMFASSPRAAVAFMCGFCVCGPSDWPVTFPGWTHLNNPPPTTAGIGSNRPLRAKSGCSRYRRWMDGIMPGCSRSHQAPTGSSAPADKMSPEHLQSTNRHTGVSVLMNTKLRLGCGAVVGVGVWVWGLC